MDDDFSQNVFYYYRVFYYDAQEFLDRYGQGKHTFTLWLYHPYTVTIGFAEGPNPDDDIVWVDGKSYRITEYSVTFTFDPPVVHVVGFWYTEEDNVEWRDSILAFRDLLCDANAHYLFGYSYITGS